MLANRVILVLLSYAVTYSIAELIFMNDAASLWLYTIAIITIITEEVIFTYSKY
jgi:hypothetical protein